MRGLPLELHGFETVLRPLSHADHCSSLDGWSTTVQVCRGRLNPRSFVEEALSERAKGRLQPLAVMSTTCDGIVGITSFETAGARPGHAVVGRTHLLDAFARRKTRLEVKYLMLRCAFQHWSCDTVTIRAPWREGLRTATPCDEAQEEVSVVHQIMEDTGRFGDMSGFAIEDKEWAMVKVRLEGRIGRHIQANIF